METIKLVEKHGIRQGSFFGKEINDLGFNAKNLYNRANYEIPQHLFETNQILSYNEMASRMQSEESYFALPRKVSQHVLYSLNINGRAFIDATKAYKKNLPSFWASLNCPSTRIRDVIY
jgi:putative transposase